MGSRKHVVSGKPFPETEGKRTVSGKGFPETTNDIDSAISARLARLRAELKKHDLDAVLVTMIDNVRYLCGFSGSTATAVVGKSDAVLLVDPRYTLQATQECPRFRVVEYQRLDQRLTKVLAEANAMKAKRLAFETEHLPYAEHTRLRAHKPSGMRLIGSRRLVDDLRLVKDEIEMAIMRRAIEISDKCFAEIVKKIEPGMTERRVAMALEFCMREAGSDKPAFDTIVASGPRGALPHAHPTDKIIEKGDLVTLDFGAECDQYPSDLTRTVCVGKSDAKQREVYNIVLEAQLAAIDAVRPGVSGKDVDAIARNHIAAAGYGDYFGHGLGHSLGRGVHDGPGLSQTSPVVLEAGMVMTVEPGIYIPDWGGVRIEDDVLVTDTGCEILTKATKELLEL